MGAILVGKCSSRQFSYFLPALTPRVHSGSVLLLTWFDKNVSLFEGTFCTVLQGNQQGNRNAVYKRYTHILLLCKSLHGKLEPVKGLKSQSTTQERSSMRRVDGPFCRCVHLCATCLGSERVWLFSLPSGGYATWVRTLKLAS